MIRELLKGERGKKRVHRPNGEGNRKGDLGKERWGMRRIEFKTAAE